MKSEILKSHYLNLQENAFYRMKSGQKDQAKTGVCKESYTNFADYVSDLKIQNSE